MLFAVHWWAHVVLVAAFLVWLPTTKHLHVVTSFFNVYLRKLEPRGALPPMDLEAEDATYGLRTLADLAWKDVLDGFTCTECGRCQDACPAHLTGKPLNPKELVMGIRHVADAAEHGLPVIPNSPDVRARGGELDDRLAPATMAIPLVPGAISEEAVWDCVTCGACVEACPVLIEHVDKIVGIRRSLVLEESRFPAELTPAFRAMESAQNPWGQPQERAPRLDEGAAVHGAGRRRRRAGGRARSARGPLLGGLRGRLRRAQPARGAGVRDLSRRGRGVASPFSARRRPAPAIRPAGWATSTSSSCSPRATSRRSARTARRAS